MKFILVILLLVTLTGFSFELLLQRISWAKSLFKKTPPAPPFA